MTELELVQGYQVLSSVAAETRKVFDRALKELIQAERVAERAGCAIEMVDETKKAKNLELLACEAADAWAGRRVASIEDSLWAALDALELATRSSPLRKVKKP